MSFLSIWLYKCQYTRTRTYTHIHISDIAVTAIESYSPLVQLVSRYAQLSKVIAQNVLRKANKLSSFHGIENQRKVSDKLIFLSMFLGYFNSS